MLRSPTPPRRAIIDIGSNSVRLVVYDGPARMPFEVHNEKVQARLGRALSETGTIDAEACELALGACRRFKCLLDAGGVRRVRTVATAAVREAANGPDLVRALRAIGLRPEVLSGAEEARASASGVLSAFPDARGVVGDLGGGSLELAAIHAGALARGGSVPLGVLRLGALRERGDKAFARQVQAMLIQSGWDRGEDRAPSERTLFLVGGSWRALGHLDMHLTGSEHPGVHGYTLSAARLDPLRRAIAELGPRMLKDVPGVSSSRIPALDGAAALLAVVAEHMAIERLTVSGFGLREGLLFQALDGTAAQRADPLLSATRDYAVRQSARRWDGDAVDDWIAPIFADDTPAQTRVRRAACHLAGVDLHPQSTARPRHGLELAWLGAWIGITAAERALLATALWAAWGGRGECDPPARFLTPEQRALAAGWGQAIRLAERISGGATGTLARLRFAREPGCLVLNVERRFADLAGGAARKHIHALAEAHGLRADIVAR